MRRPPQAPHPYGNHCEYPMKDTRSRQCHGPMGIPFGSDSGEELSIPLHPLFKVKFYICTLCLGETEPRLCHLYPKLAEQCQENRTAVYESLLGSVIFHFVCGKTMVFDLQDHLER